MEVFREEAEQAIDFSASLDEFKFEIKDIELPVTQIWSNMSKERLQNNADATDEMKGILENSKYRMDSKISFLIEQLLIATSKHTARRYSGG